MNEKPTSLELLADALGMDADDIREAAYNMRQERLNAKAGPSDCDHVWSLSWPIHPCEYICLKCGIKTTN
jgi:hypothetical protein